VPAGDDRRPRRPAPRNWSRSPMGFASHRSRGLICCGPAAGRGMTAPVLAVGDGALGFWKALREVFGDAGSTSARTFLPPCRSLHSQYSGAKAALAPPTNSATTPNYFDLKNSGRGEARG
jgi:hypothetical protein